MPVAVVPLAVLLALLLAGGFEVWRGNLRPLRLLLTPGNSWFAIGPVAVFAVAHTEPRYAGAGAAADRARGPVRGRLQRLDAALRGGPGAGLAAQLRESWVYLIDIALTGMGLVVAEQVHEHPFVALAPLPLLGLLAWFAGERRQRLVSLLELNSAYRGTALVLGDVVEADDGYTGVHCRGVLGLALAVAEELGLDAEQRRNLEFGALLHDVGKIAIPKEIVNKPGKLDPDEWQLIKTHTVEGQKMLDRIGGLHARRRPDRALPPRALGRRRLPGRPGRRGDPAGGTDRHLLRLLERDAHRPCLPQGAAAGGRVGELRANAGRQFDPRIVEMLTAIVARRRSCPSRPRRRSDAPPAEPQPRSGLRTGARGRMWLTAGPGRTVTCMSRRRSGSILAAEGRDEVW